MINFKAIIFSLLNLFGLDRSTPEIIDLAIASKHTSLLFTLAQVIRSPEMLKSIQKICKEEIPQEFVQLMQTPLPTLDDVTLYYYPEAIEIIEGKRWCSEKKYLQLIKSIDDLLEKERPSSDKYEYFTGDQIQQVRHRALVSYLKSEARINEYSIIKGDLCFNALNTLAFELTNLARIINSKKNDDKIHYDWLLLVNIDTQILYIVTFLKEIAFIDTSDNRNSKFAFNEIKDKLLLLANSILIQINNEKNNIDALNKNSNRAEHNFFLNDLRRTNQITKKMLSCLTF